MNFTENKTSHVSSRSKTKGGFPLSLSIHIAASVDALQHYDCLVKIKGLLYLLENDDDDDE